MQNKEARQRVVAHVVNQLKAGKMKSEIIAGLEEAGMDRINAAQVVDAVQRELVVEAEKEELDSTAIPKALIAAGLAAVIGGLIWGLIVSFTEYEIGYMATGIGLLTGYGVVLFTGKRGLPLQVIAVGGALVGILIGKYLSFYALLKDYVFTEFGAGAAEQITVYSIDVIESFINALPELASAYDILWIVLAVYAAWRIPRGIGWKPKNTI